MLWGKRPLKKMLPMQPGDVSVTYADIDPIVSELNFKPQTRIEVGIPKFINWYKKYKESI